MTITTKSTTTAVYATAIGELKSVLRVGQIQLPALGPKDVHIRFIAASINPSDSLAVRGYYPVPLANATVATTNDEAPIRGVPGFEGVAEVVALGSDAATTTHGLLSSPTDAAPYLAVGDWVIPAMNSLGTWRHDAVVPIADVMRVPKTGLTAAAAATLVINPTTALRMLTDYVTLNTGDVVVQNAGNSAVGQYVAQIARARGLICVSVIRDRADFDATAAKLKELGATHVVRPTDLPALVAAHPEWKVRLGLNAVGPAPELVAALGKGAALVLYGAMAPEPLALAPFDVIIKKLTVHGFWILEWKASNDDAAYRGMIDELVGMYASGALATPDYAEVVVRGDDSTKDGEASVVDGILAADRGFFGRKQLLVFH